jgi:DNA-binding NarL/FixJ family response regulator
MNAPGRKSGSISDPISETNVVVVGRDTLNGCLLADALSRVAQIHAVAVVASDFERAIEARKPEIVIVSADLNSTSLSGFHLVQAALEAHPSLLAIILLDQPTHALVVQAFRSGARGVFLTHKPMQELIHCLAHIKQGAIWADREVTDLLILTFRNLPIPNVAVTDHGPALTAREMDVVSCIAKGLTNKGAAQELRLSVNTVRNYLFRACEKLGVSNRVELLYYYMSARDPSHANSRVPAAPMHHEVDRDQGRSARDTSLLLAGHTWHVSDRVSASAKKPGAGIFV